MSEIEELRRRVAALEAQVALLAGALMPAQRREPERCAFDQLLSRGDMRPMGLACYFRRCRPYSMGGVR